MDIEKYILAIDPGNEKTGIAILRINGDLEHRLIADTNLIMATIESLITTYFGICHIVCGNGTNHKSIYPMVQQIGRNHRITTSLIDESHSTEEARKLYWQYNPPKGWRAIIPKGMQFPPEPVDDLTAYVIGQRYTTRIGQNEHKNQEGSIDSQVHESKRLQAIERLYKEGDTHE